MHVTPQRVNEIEPSTYEIIVNIIPRSFKFALLYVLGVVPFVINSVYMGHVASKNQLAAVGLGNMMMNIFVLFTIDGLASGIDILSSQAYGAKENRLACIPYQRARMVTALQCLWIVPIFCFTERWMTAIGQDPIVSKFAGEYTRAAAPFVIIFTDGTCMCKLYLAFLRPGKLMALSVILTPLHAVWVHIFVGVCSLGNAGLGLAFGTGSIVRYIAIACLLWKDAPELGVQRHWIFWFERESFSGWCAYLKVAAPCMCQTILEALYYEIVSLLAGYLGPTSLAATSITITCIWLPMALPYGLAVGTTILIGNAIGSGSVAMVKKTAVLSVWLALACWAVIALMIFVFSDHLARLLTAHADIQRMSRVFLLTFSVSGFFDSSQLVMAGILKGLGLVSTPVFTYGIMYYLVMLPSAILLAFKLNLGAEGLWLSFFVGTGSATLIYALRLSSVDYEALTSAARAVMHKEE